MKLSHSILIIFLLINLQFNIAQANNKLDATSQNNKINTVLSQLSSSMIHIKGGYFSMGSNLSTAQKRELPQHPVKLKDFYLLKTEVTQKLFQQIMGWNVSYFVCDSCPVNNITWKQMHKFIDKLNELTGEVYRLPTEAEWEYAARGGSKSKGFKYSGSNNINDVAWYFENAQRKSHPVALKKPNELGFYDMTGNLWEFVVDDMDRNFYKRSPTKNPANITAPNKQVTAMKVIRGSGYEFSANESDVYKRDGATSNVKLPDIGFRLAKSVK